MLYTFCAWLFSMFQPRILCELFTPDGALVEASVKMLRVYFAGFFFQSFQFCRAERFSIAGLGEACHHVFAAAQGGHRRAVDAAAADDGLWHVGVFLAEPVSNIVGGLACYITMLALFIENWGRRRKCVSIDQIPFF